MRKILTLEAGTAAAMAEFNTRLAPPAYPAAPRPSPATKCDARTCPWWPYTNSNDFKANTALILVILLCALICSFAFNAAIRYIVRVHCSRRRRQNEEDPKAELGAAAVEIPVMIYSEGVKLTRAEAECIICLSEFAIGDKIRVLDKCDHGFHLQCIQKWLASHSSCPTCRTDCTLESNASQP